MELATTIIHTHVCLYVCINLSGFFFFYEVLKHGGLRL
jgi:hypothetical protein